MSIIFAKVLGFYFLAVGLAALFNPEQVKSLYRDIMNDRGFLFLGAMTALLIGGAVVALHNEWSVGWPLLITILGWWSLVKGYLLMVWPESIRFFSFIQNRSLAFYRGIGIFYTLLGAFFLYHGFW